MASKACEGLCKNGQRCKNLHSRPVLRVHRPTAWESTGFVAPSSATPSTTLVASHGTSAYQNTRSSKRRVDSSTNGSGVTGAGRGQASSANLNANASVTPKGLKSNLSRGRRPDRSYMYGWPIEIHDADDSHVATESVKRTRSSYNAHASASDSGTSLGFVASAGATGVGVHVPAASSAGSTFAAGVQPQYSSYSGRRRGSGIGAIADSAMAGVLRRDWKHIESLAHKNGRRIIKEGRRKSGLLGLGSGSAASPGGSSPAAGAASSSSSAAASASAANGGGLVFGNPTGLVSQAWEWGMNPAVARMVARNMSGLGSNGAGSSSAAASSTASASLGAHAAATPSRYATRRSIAAASSNTHAAMRSTGALKRCSMTMVVGTLMLR